MAWQPNENDLQQVAQLLQSSVGRDPALRDAAYHQLKQFLNNPDFTNCLACVFAHPSAPTETRTLAGLHLKNVLKDSLDRYDLARLAYIKQCVATALLDVEDAVRRTAGSIIASVLDKDLALWPEILQTLLQYVDHTETRVVRSALDTFKKICEDIGKNLDNANPEFVTHMLAKFIVKIDDPDPVIRAAAIFCVSQFVSIQSRGLENNIGAFINALYKTTNDTDPAVCKMICRSLVMLLQTYPQALFPEIGNVIKFMIHSTQSQDDEVAKEACEFWLAIASIRDFTEQLRPYLDQIVSILIKGMVYKDDDPEVQGLEDNAHLEDKDTDIKPRFHKSRVAVDHNRKDNGGDSKFSQLSKTDGDGVKSGNNNNNNNSNNTNSGDGNNNNNNNDDDDDDDSMLGDDDDDDIYGEWNLRKCSAMSLDSLANVFQNDILVYVLPILENQLGNPDWKLREASILALGAIAEGCLLGVLPDLPQMIPFLISALKDTNILVRSITCWTLGRYSIWIVAPPPEFTYENSIEKHHKMFLEPMLESLLTVVLDDNKRVQEAACSALATIEDESRSELIPYLRYILATLNKAFDKYQSKNIIILYDAVGTLAENVGSALQDDQLIKLLMPPLITKWRTPSDLDSGLFPLLECMATVATALGECFIPYAKEVWERCLQIIFQIFQQMELYYAAPSTVEPPDKDLIVVALDLLSGVAQSVDGYTAELVPLGSPNIMQLLLPCMQDLYPDVRQSVHALIGDLAISAFPHLQPFVPTIMPEIIKQIDMDPLQMSNILVCNNAAWAAGEIAWRSDASFEQYITQLLQRLIPILCGNRTQRTLIENAAITIARLGKVNAQLVSPYLPTFIQPWCYVIKMIQDNSDKASAFVGILEIVSVDPLPVVKQDSDGRYTVFMHFASAILSWRDIPPELNKRFFEILSNFKTFLAANWTIALSSWPPHMRQVLASRYNL